MTGDSGRGGGPGAGQALTTGSPPSAMPRHHPPARVLLRGRAAPAAAFYGAAAAAPAAPRRCACARRTAWRRPAALCTCAVASPRPPPARPRPGGRARGRSEERDESEHKGPKKGKIGFFKQIMLKKLVVRLLFTGEFLLVMAESSPGVPIPTGTAKRKDLCPAIRCLCN